MNKVYKNKKGVAVVYLAISMTVLLLFSALVIDIGMLTLNKSKIQNACDAAALAGAKELPNDTVAKDVAKKYLKNAGIEDVNIVEPVVTDPKNKITVAVLNKPVDFFFARIMGKDQGFASARASAMIAPVVGGISGLKPFGLKKTDFVVNKEYVIKDDSGTADSGNFQWVDIPVFDTKPNGSIQQENAKDALAWNILNESQESYHVYNPDSDNEDGAITSYTGNMPGTVLKIAELYNRCTPECASKCASEGPSRDCPRVITVPILGDPSVLMNSDNPVITDMSTKDKEAGKTTYPIVGFARFMITSIEVVGSNPTTTNTACSPSNIDTKKNGNLLVKGKFIEQVTEGEVDPSQTDYEHMGVMLSD